MALFNIENWDLKDDKKHFKDLYEMTYEKFIDYYVDDNIIMDLTGKIVVSLRADSDKNLPIDLLTIFIPEGEKYKYKTTLIYSGHIAFVKLERESGKVDYLYKDDECYPQIFDEAISEDNGDTLYCAKEKGFTKEDILSQIEKFIQSNYDFNYKLDKENIIVLEGL